MESFRTRRKAKGLRSRLVACARRLKDTLENGPIFDGTNLVPDPLRPWRSIKAGDRPWVMTRSEYDRAMAQLSFYDALSAWCPKPDQESVFFNLRPRP